MVKDSAVTRFPLRVVTATALFDGHDVSVNLFRRMLQEAGVEVIHLGHNRSVAEIVDAAVSEDVHGVAVSSYQGGHMEFFSYLLEMFRERGRGDIALFGGGGGVITPEEKQELEEKGVLRIFTPEDGVQLGLEGIVAEMVAAMDVGRTLSEPTSLEGLSPDNTVLLARLLTLAEEGRGKGLLGEIAGLQGKNPPVIGVTGTGGAGKSTLIDELLLRLVHDYPELKIGVLCSDPTRRKTGGALLGDRMRMNAASCGNVFMRSLATRAAFLEVPETLASAISVMKAAGMDLIFVETSGIGQAGDAIITLSDHAIYVMTPDFGAETQLEKIGMLDYADLFVVNKHDKRGGEDAVNLVRRQVRRNRHAFEEPLSSMPVFGTTASVFQDHGVTELYRALLGKLKEEGQWEVGIDTEATDAPHAVVFSGALSAEREHYLSDVAEAVRAYHRKTEEESVLLEKLHSVRQAMALCEGKGAEELQRRGAELEASLDSDTRDVMAGWAERVVAAGECDPETTTTLSGTRLPRVALPGYRHPAELYRFLRREHLPGCFPFTAGVFPLKQKTEDPTRMFAGEGGPLRTNQRFHMLSKESPSNRLSTAFDSVTLYGRDPDRRPDIYGKIGNAGVSVCTLDDVKELYRGFHLCSPDTSVSMTINGPAPVLTAMFFNTAIDQEAIRFEKEVGRLPLKEERQRIRREVLENLRGTVQADILKEDQGQNTSLFSIDFALRMMGDVQQWCIEEGVRRFYPVSISGYHIAEAGANPITQLGFTLANGFTYLEYFKARGLSVDDVARRFSFFFSNGMDAEYTVIGRVARRIWAVALKEVYGASEPAQKLKYHIQTSGRSLHSREMQFNDIRTTLQALCAMTDHCNSLHTNAFDEAVTTPTEASVRRALAVQLIVQREWGLSRCENALQGSFVVEQLTDVVEEAVLEEFHRLSLRGGVLGAMETGYQRAKIQEESMLYEMGKNNGTLPIIGVNTFTREEELSQEIGSPVLARSTEEEKEAQLDRLAIFHDTHKKEAPEALSRLRQVALSGGNIFAALMDTVRVCSLGQITETLFSVGGTYRRQI